MHGWISCTSSGVQRMTLIVRCRGYISCSLWPCWDFKYCCCTASGEIDQRWKQSQPFFAVGKISTDCLYGKRRHILWVWVSRMHCLVTQICWSFPNSLHLFSLLLHTWSKEAKPFLSRDRCVWTGKWTITLWKVHQDTVRKHCLGDHKQYKTLVIIGLENNAAIKLMLKFGVELDQGISDPSSNIVEI